MNDTVTLEPQIDVYGGFAGNETTRGARNWVDHPTILKGTDPTETNHVATVVVGADNARLDGFTITGAQGGAGSKGGGLAAESVSGVTVANCTFTENSAAQGGAIAGTNATLTLTNCTLANNTADSYAGAVYHYGGTLTISGCEITGNTVTSASGGALYVYEIVLTVENSTFTGNAAGTTGSGGAIEIYWGGPNTMTNCVFDSNSAPMGGGVRVMHSSATFTNCTFYGNTAANYGGGVYLESNDSVGTFVNTIFWGNTAGSGGASIHAAGGPTLTAQHSDIQGSALAGTNGNIDANPQFVDAPNGDFRLDFGNSSPCIDAGYGDNYVTVPQADITGYTPRYDASLSGTNGGAGTPNYVDMGAYEYHP